jgi:hypothetical protein
MPGAPPFAGSAKSGIDLQPGKGLERPRLKSLQLHQIPPVLTRCSDEPLVIVCGHNYYTALEHPANAILRVGRGKSHHTETLIAQYATRQRISIGEGYADEFCTDTKSAEHHGTLPTLQEHATASVRNVLPECRNALRTQNNHG